MSRYRCNRCLQFMALDAGFLPLHVDYEGKRMCPGSATEDHEEAGSCYCFACRMPPCWDCENGYADHGDAEPDAPSREMIEAAFPVVNGGELAELGQLFEIEFTPPAPEEGAPNHG